MFIEIESLKIKVPGGEYVSLGHYSTDSSGKPVALITEAKYSYNKLWSSDSGRSLSQGYNQVHLLEYFQK